MDWEDWVEIIGWLIAAAFVIATFAFVVLMFIAGLKAAWFLAFGG